ncbi:MAG: helix-turn-helix transcriptional regulator [Coprobacillus cateniformis]|nr:helix-turn-helix transcriptional regulator [Coprobacillus cateniformis]
MIDREMLKRYIHDNGIKQRAISDKTGISETSISMILSGDRKCEVNEYARICKYLGVPFSKFIKKTD